MIVPGIGGWKLGPKFIKDILLDKFIGSNKDFSEDKLFQYIFSLQDDIRKLQKRLTKFYSLTQFYACTQVKSNLSQSLQTDRPTDQWTDQLTTRLLELLKEAKKKYKKYYINTKHEHFIL